MRKGKTSKMLIGRGLGFGYWWECEMFKIESPAMHHKTKDAAKRHASRIVRKLGYNPEFHDA